MAVPEANKLSTAAVHCQSASMQQLSMSWLEYAVAYVRNI